MTNRCEILLCMAAEEIATATGHLALAASYADSERRGLALVSFRAARKALRRAEALVVGAYAIRSPGDAL